MRGSPRRRQGRGRYLAQWLLRGSGKVCSAWVERGLLVPRRVKEEGLALPAWDFPCQRLHAQPLPKGNPHHTLFQK